MRHAISVRISKQLLLKHFIICGATGSGKSVLMMNMFYDLIRTTNYKNSASLILIEPHGDFSGKMAFARIIPKERLVLICSGNTINRDAGTQNITGTFNPFAHDGSESMKYCLTHELTRAIGELLSSSEHASQFSITVQMATLLSPAIAVVLESKYPSMIELKRMFSPDNEDLLDIGRNFSHPQIREFFLNDWDNEAYKITKNSIKTKLSYFLNDTFLYNMLAYNINTSLEDYINKGSIIIFHLPKGAAPFAASIIGRLATAYIYAVSMRKEATHPSKRLPIYLFIDEVQNYLSPSLAASLQESRKYSTGIVMAVQSLRSLETATRQAILTNTGTKACSVTDAASRLDMSREMGIETSKLADLESLRFYIKQGGNSNPFRFTVSPLSDHLFYTEESEKQALYKYLIERGDFYAQVPELPAATLPPPPSPSTKSPRQYNGSKARKSSSGDSSMGEGLTPAF